MKKALLLFLFIFSALITSAQQQPAQKPSDPNRELILDSPIDTSKNVQYDPNRIYTSVETLPVFPGGYQSFYKYLAQNIHYPASAVKNHIQGKVFMTFVVEKDGSLTDLRVIRGVYPEIDAEATRVLKASPKWQPGLQNGKPVRVLFTVPIDFSLSAK